MAVHRFDKPEPIKYDKSKHDRIRKAAEEREKKWKKDSKTSL